MSASVLVTGGAGFVGRHLLNALREDTQAKTRVAWRRPRQDTYPTARVQSYSPTSAASIQWRDVDLLDRASVEQAVADLRPSWIYHCAGLANVSGSWQNTLQTLEGNVIGTQHLLEAVQRAQLKTRILVPGSALVYRPSSRAIEEDDSVGPVSPYGLSKLAQEMLSQRFAKEGQAVLLTRSFTHFGPGQDLSYAASSFAHQVACIEAGQAEPVIRVGSLEPRRDLTDVRDTVRAYRELMERGRPGRIYNVCSGRAHQIREVLHGLLTRARVSVDIEVDPARLRPSDNPLLLGNPTRITQEIGWSPRINLEKTLDDLLNYWRQVIAS